MIQINKTGNFEYILPNELQQKKYKLIKYFNTFYLINYNRKKI